MAGLLDLLSGRSSDIYGAGLLTPEQRGGIGNIGLLALAGKLGQLAGPSFSPVPDFGAALGQAAGAYGASQEGAGTAALNAILTGQKGRKLQQELDYYQKLGPVLSKLGGDWPGADGGTAATPETGSTGGGAAAPLGAGGGGGGGGGAGAGGISPTDHYTFLLNNGASHNEATLLTSAANAESSFRPDITHDGGIGYGLYGHNDTRLVGMRSFAGVGAKDPVPWQQQALYALAELRGQVPGGGEIKAGNMARAATTPEQLTDAQLAFERPKGWNTGGGNREQRLAATREYFAKTPYGQPAAAAPAGGGGPLAVPAPNPLSDAEPMLPIVRPAAAPGAGAAAVAPNQVGRFAGVAPGTPVNSGGFPYNPEITDPAVAARVAQSMAAIKLAQQSGVPWAAPRETSGGGGLLAPEDPGAGYGGGPPQGPAGDVGPAGPAGPVTPRAPLPTMGPTGVELPPMQGPLAAPAPAAAAPAAPGPGLLSPPGAPAAALPRVNPAYDAFLRNAGLAGALAKGAGLTDVLGPLTEALTKSPSYQAALETARKAAGLPFIGPETTAKKAAEEPFDIRASERALGNSLTEKGWRLDANGQAVRIPGYDQMTEATALATARGTGEGGLPTTLIIKSVENQNKIIADAAANGNQVTFDKDGKMSVSRLPGADAAAAASAAATTGAQEQAKADVAAGTAPDIARRTKYAEGVAAQDTAARAQAIAARNTLPLLDDAKEQLTGAGIFSGPRANLDMTLAQLGAAFNWPSDKLVNTQTYIQQAGARAAEILRSGAYGTGSGISQNDLRAADKLANGDITLDIKTIKRIMDLAERKAARDIDNFNAIANKRDPGSAVEHPPRWTGRYTSDGKRIDKMPDGSLQVKE